MNLDRFISPTGTRDRSRRSPHRIGALVCLLLLTGAFVSVLYDITTILGGSNQLWLRIMFAIVLAYASARYVELKIAVVVFAILAGAGFVWYFAAVGDGLRWVFGAPASVLFAVLGNVVTLTTGQSVLTIQATDVWALSFAPAPIFITWYLGFRRHYVLASIVGLAGTTFFVLSGDLGLWWTLAGTIGAGMAVAFGRYEAIGASLAHLEWLVVVLAGMLVVAMIIPVVPGGGVLGPLSVIGDSGIDPTDTTLEGNVIGTGSELEVTGNVDLSPQVRYTIEGDADGYWRTDVYDRYTGDGWIRTGEESPYTGTLPTDATGERVSQHVRVETATTQLPAAAVPASIVGISNVDVTDHGALLAGKTVPEGSTYHVTSVIPSAAAGDQYGEVPHSIGERYTQLPEDVPERVHQLSADLVHDADGIVEKADIIEHFLRNEKAYSLEVDQPSGDLVDGFLFEMEAGYCTYFASAMVVMLRSADVPARLAVGYGSGQQVDDDRWVVRGLDAHAWVEVYVPDAGWVTFEPTPPGDRLDVHLEYLEDARLSDDYDAVDTVESEPVPVEGMPEEPDEPVNETPPGNVTDDPFDEPPEDALIDPGIAVPPSVSLEDYTDDDTSDRDWVSMPVTLEGSLVILALTIGSIAGIRHTQLHSRVRRECTLRYHLGAGTPQADLERSLERVEWALATEYRPRKPRETYRQYQRMFALTHDDERVERFYRILEQAKYGGTINRATADELKFLADEIVADRVRFGGAIPVSRVRRRIRR